MKVSFLLRLKFAWYAFMMKKYEHVFPYEYHCDLRKDWQHECDNIRRVSQCKNEGKVALANPVFEIRFDEHGYYHVCDKCAKKYIGTVEGESC